MKLVILICGFLCIFSQTESIVNFLFTSSWYGGSTDVTTAKGLTIDITDCVKNDQFTPVYVASGLSMLSSFNNLDKEAKILSEAKIAYAIGESNEFLNLIYFSNTNNPTRIQQMYPTDEELMNVVLKVFETVYNPTISKQKILVIINQTQDFNNLDINNYENIIRKFNNKTWIDVIFLPFISIENIIAYIRQVNYFTIISVLSDPEVNAQLINRIYLAHLMVWRYQWIIVDLLGGYNYLSTSDYGQGVLSNNVTIITFGQNGYSGRSILLQAAFNLTIADKCSSLPIMRQTLTGNFDSKNRITFQFNVLQNPGIQNKSLGYLIYERLSGKITLPPLLQYNNLVFTYNLSLINLKVTGFKIGYIEYPPFSYMENGTYAGFTVMLFNNLLKDFNITPTYIPLPIKNIGNFILSNYSFNGVLGYVQNGTIDTLSVPIILTINRLTYFDFATNVVSGNIVGAYKSSQPIGINALTNYITPFDWSVWTTLLCSSVAIAIGLTITDYMYPDKYARYKILMSVFFSFSSLTHGAYFDPPRRTGGRILMCFWWLYCLFVVVIWVSNFAALLARSYTETQLTAFTDILNQIEFKYTTVNDDLLYSFLRNNPYPNPQTIYRIMKEETLNGTVNTIEDALSLVQNKYIFLYDDKTLYYQSTKTCLKMFGKFAYFDYGIILPKYSEKTLVISTKLRQLAVMGNTSKLIDETWPSQFQSCNTTDLTSIVAKSLASLIKYPLPNSFKINTMIGVFVLAIIGGVAAMILAIIEKFIRVLILKTQQQRDKYKYETTVEQLTTF